MTSRAQLPPLPPGIRTLTDAESAALNSQRPEARHTPRQCKTCQGTKTFRWYTPADAREVVADYDCPCTDQYLLYRWFAHCGIYPAYMKMGWADIADTGHEGVKAVVEYVSNHQAYRAQGFGLVLSGGRGTGKTLLLQLLGKALIAEGVDCYSVTFSDMIDAFAEGWRNRDTSKWFAKRIRNAGVLLIDDLGRERNKGPESVGDNMLETITRYRTASLMPTLLTTNLTEHQVHTGYGGHTMSLLSESAIFVTVPGGDFREQKKQRAKAERDAGLTRPVMIG